MWRGAARAVPVPGRPLSYILCDRDIEGTALSESVENVSAGATRAAVVSEW